MAAKVDLALGVLKEREANLAMIKATLKPIMKPPKTLSFTINPDTAKKFPKTLSFAINLDTTINTYKVQIVDTETKNHNTINFKKFSFKNLVL